MYGLKSINQIYIIDFASSFEENVIDIGNEIVVLVGNLLPDGSPSQKLHLALEKDYLVHFNL